MKYLVSSAHRTRQENGLLRDVSSSPRIARPPDMELNHVTVKSRPHSASSAKMEGSNYSTSPLDRKCQKMLEERLERLGIELQKVNSTLNRIAWQDAHEPDEAKSEWILAAIALERICFVLFCSVTIGFTAFFFIYGQLKLSNDIIQLNQSM